MDFELAAEHEELLAVARKVSKIVAEGYVRRDREHSFPHDVLTLIGQAGLLGLTLSPELGGQGAGYVAAGLVAEELAYADIFAGSMIVQASTGLKLLERFADPDLARRWIPRLLAGEMPLALGLTEPQSGSDLRNLTTKARRDGDGWRIRGEKSSVTFGNSPALIILALADDGPALFFVEDREGVSTQQLDDLGFSTSERSVMSFDDVRVEQHHRLRATAGLKAIYASLTSARLVVCMTALGLGRAAVDDAIGWTKERVTFGAPLSTRQGVAFPLVQHSTDLELGRLITLKGLWLADQGRAHDREAAMAKSWIPERIVEMCHFALLMNGHVGYTREHPSQLRLRDAIGLELGEGPSNIQRILLARQLLGTNPG